MNDAKEGFEHDRDKRRCENYQLNFHEIKPNGVKKLKLERMERFIELDSQNLFGQYWKK
jgi:hypothetical protein